MPHFVRLLEKHSTYEVLSDLTADKELEQGKNLTRGGSSHSLSKPSDILYDIKVSDYDELLDNVIGSWYGARTGREEDPFYELMVLSIFLLRLVNTKLIISCVIFFKTNNVLFQVQFVTI